MILHSLDPGFIPWALLRMICKYRIRSKPLASLGMACLPLIKREYIENNDGFAFVYLIQSPLDFLDRCLSNPSFYIRNRFSLSHLLCYFSLFSPFYPQFLFSQELKHSSHNNLLPVRSKVTAQPPKSCCYHYCWFALTSTYSSHIPLPWTVAHYWT